MIPGRKHFHTFDGLRFISFLLVFLHHSPHPDTAVVSFFTRSGGVGVLFFFVLSGFLITYLLLTEKLSTGRIALGKFFVRRILRIWPLYYAMVLFAFLTPFALDLVGIPYSNEGYTPDWKMTLLFLENYQMMWEGTLPNVSPLGVMWSLCIEEHFYLIWGIVFYFLPLKRIWVFILGCLLTGVVCRGIYDANSIATLDILSNIDFFAYGAIPAYLLVFREKILTMVERIPSSLKYGLMAAGFFLAFGLPGVEIAWISPIAPILYGLTFAGIILLTLPEKNPLKIPDRWLISRLGIYTYGLYLFHTIVINFLLQVSGRFDWDTNLYALGLLALILTILISLASFYLFETPFLKLKKYFY